MGSMSATAEEIVEFLENKAKITRLYGEPLFADGFENAAVDARLVLENPHILRGSGGG